MLNNEQWIKKLLSLHNCCLNVGLGCREREKKMDVDNELCSLLLNRKVFINQIHE